MDSRRGVALALAALLLVLSPNLSSARPGPRRADTIVSVAEYDLQKHHPELGCRDGECGIVEKCFGKKCWEITCPPCKDSATGVFDLATDLALGKKDGKWNCTAAQCGTNQTKCITVPVVGDICWNVTCPACGGDDKEVAGPVFLLDEELAKDGKGKKHYGCTPEDCGTTKDVCITVPVKGEVCWKVKCPACPDAGEPTMLSLLDMGKKDGKWNCTAAQCGTNQTKCINIPVVGDVCWNVTCPACGGDDKEVAGPAFLLEELAKDGKGKKHYGCTPEDCGTTKDVCITVPVKGEVCWKVKCPACPDAGEPTMLSLLDMGKKDGKWNCTAAQCGTNQTKCINIPVVGDVCWNVTCPACGGDDKEVAGPAFLLEEELAKDGKGKKHFGCTPEDCGTTKDVCITVPVKGEVCWKVKCPACPDAGEPTMLSLLDMGKKDGKWNCTAAQCGTNQTKCINIPVVGDICWNVTCPACGGDDKEVAGPAFLLEELAKDGKGKKHYGCTPEDCGTTKDVCITVPVKGEVCWKVKCPACPDAGEPTMLSLLDMGKKDGKWNCTAAQCGTNQTKCINIPVVGDVCWNVTCPACGGDDKEVAGPAFLLEELAKDGKGKKHYGCTPEYCGTTKDVCITVPVKGEVCWKVKCPACPVTKGDIATDYMSYL